MGCQKEGKPFLGCMGRVVPQNKEGAFKSNT